MNDASGARVRIGSFNRGGCSAVGVAVTGDAVPVGLAPVDGVHAVRERSTPRAVAGDGGDADAVRNSLADVRSRVLDRYR